MADRNIAAKLRTKIKNLEEQNHSLNSIFDSLQPGTVHATALELRAEVERLRALVKDAYLEGYGQTGAWTRRESSWNDSEAKKKLG